jgi:hypothetical protein
MAEQLDETDLGRCSSCGQVAEIVSSRPLPAHLVGLGAGPMRAFAHFCESCLSDPSRRTSRTYTSTPIRDPWWSK